MHEKQVRRFWDELDSSASVQDAVSALANKKGYKGKRTLERYAHAANGFREGLASGVIAEKTGWSVEHVNKIRGWWEQRASRQAQDEERLHRGISYEQRFKERERPLELIQVLRQEVASYSPVRLFQDWLGKTNEDAITSWYCSTDVETLYQEAGERDGEPLQPKPLAQSQSPFELLKQRFPDSEVWDAAGTWSERKTSYVGAFHQMLKEIESIVVRELATVLTRFAENGVEGIDWIDCAAFPGFEKRCRFERLLTVLVACDALALGIAKRPSKPYRADLVNALRALRLTTDVELSKTTDIPARGGWRSGIPEVWEQAPQLAVGLTSEFLDRLGELQSAEESVLRALKQLESGT